MRLGCRYGLARRLAGLPLRWPAAPPPRWPAGLPGPLGWWVAELTARWPLRCRCAESASASALAVCRVGRARRLADVPPAGLPPGRVHCRGAWGLGGPVPSMVSPVCYHVGILGLPGGLLSAGDRRSTGFQHFRRVFAVPGGRVVPTARAAAGVWFPPAPGSRGRPPSRASSFGGAAPARRTSQTTRSAPRWPVMIDRRPGRTAKAAAVLASFVGHDETRTRIAPTTPPTHPQADGQPPDKRQRTPAHPAGARAWRGKISGRVSSGRGRRSTGRWQGTLTRGDKRCGSW
jgi:hypothetical protein